MFTYIFYILEFPGIISFPENYLETIGISQNWGNFLQSRNTEYCKRAIALSMLHHKTKLYLDFYAIVPHIHN